MAVHFHGLAQTSSVIRRIQRFLKDQAIDYQALARGIVTALPLAATFDIVIDRTNWQFGKCPVNFLVLSITLWGRQSVPLFWKALPKKGASSGQEQVDLLQRFIKVFGHQRIQSLTADREFISGQWLSFLHANKIPFYIRLRQDRLVEWEGNGEKPLKAFFQHLKQGEKRLLYKEIANLPMVVAGTRSPEGELVLIATNQLHLKAAQILNIYRRRWATETLFKATKTAGINFEDTHITDPTKLEKLMAIAAVAVTLCVCIGQTQEKLKPTPYKKTVQANLYSTFRRGFDALRRWLCHNMHLHEIITFFENLIITNHQQKLKNVV